jgi:phage terminase large subunit
MAIRPVDEVVADLRGKTVKMLQLYRRNPAAFCRDVLRVEPQEWQVAFMQAVADSRAGKLDKSKFAVRSGTGVGKTMAVACLILWHTCCFEDSKIICTAPTSPQIKAVLWPELRKWKFKIPDEILLIFPLDITTDMVALRDDIMKINNLVMARTAREESPEAFQGFHEGNIMLIADEASGVPDAIYNAGQGVMSSEGAILILIGNPTRAVGYFYDAFHGDSHLYWTMRVGCDMSPMVQPKYLEEMRAKHGEDSYEYKVRVMGEFHLEDAGLIIPRPWIEASVDKEMEADTDYIVWGVDLSDGGKDKSAICKRQGNKVLEKTKSWGGRNANQFVEILADEFFETPFKLRPQEICIDGVGMGGIFTRLVRDALANENVKITLVNVAGTKPRGDRFVSRRVELWNMGREWFQTMLVSVPNDAVLIAQLSSIEWELNANNGKMFIPDKRASGSSPDEADAFILTFAGVKGKNKSMLTEKSKYANMVNDTRAIGSASYL